MVIVKIVWNIQNHPMMARNVFLTSALMSKGLQKLVIVRIAYSIKELHLTENSVQVPHAYHVR
jgi:hypothetical protein